MSRPAEWLPMLALCLASVARADAPPAQPAPAPPPEAKPAPPPAAAKPPDLLELLEFLGTFESEDGEWVDPFMLEDAPVEATRAPAQKRPSDD